jgi:hypothetical protein
VKLRQGWSGEVGGGRWAKFDLSLDETDLRRLLVDAGIDVDPVELPLTLAFRLLEAEAETLVLAKLVSRYGMDGSTAATRISELSAAKTQALQQIRAR